MTHNPSLRKSVKHPPHEEGSRQHVISWHGVYRNGRIHGERRCSDPNCEINR